MNPPHVNVPGSGRSGAVVLAVVLLWIFVGWPLSWFLLFLFAPLGILFGIAITVGMIVMLATSSGSSSQTVVVNVGAGAAPPQPVPPRSTYVDDVRHQIESLAAVNAIGGCGWCGSTSAHVNEGGYLVHPRFWHAAEIEERVRAKVLG